jgi:hypothetical protein
MSSALPAAYRWFLLRGLTDWTPWRLQDDSSAVNAPTNFERSKYFQHQCKIETGADFDFYLFARRQDREDFAFFFCGPDGRVEDSTITIHLSFSGRLEFTKGALTRPAGNEKVSFIQWIRAIATEDMQDWIEDFEAHPEFY